MTTPTIANDTVTAPTKARRKPAAQQPAAAPVAASEEETATQLRNRLRNEAEREILNRHKEEFVEVAKDLFGKHGLIFRHRKTDAERAQDKINELLKQHPELRSQFEVQVAVEPIAADTASVEFQRPSFPPGVSHIGDVIPGLVPASSLTPPVSQGIVHAEPIYYNEAEEAAVADPAPVEESFYEELGNYAPATEGYEQP